MRLIDSAVLVESITGRRDSNIGSVFCYIWFHHRTILNMLNIIITTAIFCFLIHTLVDFIVLRFLRFKKVFLLYAVAILPLVLVRKRITYFDNVGKFYFK